jgi:hypothetical protein
LVGIDELCKDFGTLKLEKGTVGIVHHPYCLKHSKEDDLKIRHEDGEYNLDDMNHVERP